MRGSRLIAWGMMSLSCLSIPVLLAVNEASGEYADGILEALPQLAAVLGSSAIGVIVAVRVPRNPIGWLLLGNALLLGLSGFARVYAGFALEHPPAPGGRLAAVYDTNGWPVLFAAIVAIAFIFPDGRLVSRARIWRWAPVWATAAFVLSLTGGMLSDYELDSPFGSVPPYDALPRGVAEAMQTVGLVGMIVTFCMAGGALVIRFRRADGDERQQLKWVAYSAVLIPVAIIAGTVEGLALDTDPGVATDLSFAAVAIAVPAAVGVAVLRYRLYEIDRIIYATLVYGSVTVLLGAVFAAITVVAGVVLGGGAALPTAVATLAVALAFGPLRTRVQRLVDRRLRPERYRGLRAVDAFLDDLRLGRSDPEAVGDVIGRAVSDPGLCLLFWLPRDGVHADATGRVVDPLPPLPRARTPVRRGELELGVILHAPALSERPELLDAVIVRAGLAIEIARLRVEVRRRLAEVEESRSRIVAATYEERRRLERDIHDGAQQRLVALGLDLRHLQHGLGAGDAVSSGLDAAVGSLTEAIQELRELARGVRPAVLDDGLASALAELAARAPIRTVVEATRERFAPKLEAAAYFVANEALTNAVKHSAGTNVNMRVVRRDGVLVLSVSDDGNGGAEPRPSSGLIGLNDRVSALGGSLRLETSADGTLLVAEFPCES